MSTEICPACGRPAGGNDTQDREAVNRQFAEALMAQSQRRPQSIRDLLKEKPAND
jgi:hypothetical protein